MFQKSMQNRFFIACLLCFYFMCSDFIYQLNWIDYLMYSFKYEGPFSLTSEWGHVTWYSYASCSLLEHWIFMCTLENSCLSLRFIVKQIHQHHPSQCHVCTKHLKRRNIFIYLFICKSWLFSYIVERRMVFIVFLLFLKHREK